MKLFQSWFERNENTKELDNASAKSCTFGYLTGWIVLYIENTLNREIFRSILELIIQKWIA